MDAPILGYPENDTVLFPKNTVTGVVLAAAGGSSAALQPRGHGANHMMVLAAAKATPILGHSN